MKAGFYRQSTRQLLRGAVLSMFVTTGYAAAESTERGASVMQQDAEAFNIQTAIQKQQNTPLELVKKVRQLKPEDPAIAAQVATLYIQKARQEAAPEYYQRALFVLRPWWRVEQLPPEIALVRATLYQHEHHYAEASKLLLDLLKQQPQHRQAWLLLSSIQLVQGEYKNAAASCDALSRVASPWYGGICYSQIYSLTGRAKDAYMMQQALLEQLEPEQRELRVWVNALLAETSLRRNKTIFAERHYLAILELRPNDVHALRSYSDFLLRQHRHQDVIERLKPYLAEDALLLRTAMAAKQANNKGLEQALVTRLKKRFAKALSEHGHSHSRDEALFLLAFSDDKARALQLATANWQQQKEPEDIRVLLEAALASHNHQGAQPVIAWVEKHKLEDPIIHGMIQRLEL